MNSVRFIITAILCLMNQLSFGVSHTKLWGLASYFGQYKQLLYTVEPQIRWVDNANVYEQSLFNAGIGINMMPKLQIWLGQTYTNYANSNNVDEDVNKNVLNEQRIWQQIVWQRPFSDELASRTRMEQRRAFQSPEWAVRLRERVYWTIPIYQTISFALSDEMFLNLKSVPWVSTSTFDQNRLFVGIYYNLTPEIGVNISYFNQYITRNPVEVNHGLVLNLVAYMF